MPWIFNTCCAVLDRGGALVLDQSLYSHAYVHIFGWRGTFQKQNHENFNFSESFTCPFLLENDHVKCFPFLISLSEADSYRATGIEENPEYIKMQAHQYIYNNHNK